MSLMAFTRPYILPYTDTLICTHSNVKEDHSEVKIPLENYFSVEVHFTLSHNR